jgi:hypothetical protein
MSSRVISLPRHKTTAAAFGTVNNRMAEVRVPVRRPNPNQAQKPRPSNQIQQLSSVPQILPIYS